MDNEEKDADDEGLTQQAREQQGWERLQNEALAAQRWRLEQEQEAARKKSDPDAVSGASQSLKQTPPNRVAIVALVSFIIISLLIAVVYAW